MKKLPAIMLVIILLIGFPRIPAGAADEVPSVPSLCQLHYPSDYLLEWKCVQIKETDTPRKIFGKYWLDGLRFNRLDRRHFIAGMGIKVPKRMKEIRHFNPMPPIWDEAQLEPQFILIDQNEMFLGAYEYGTLVFSTPVAVGSDGYRLANGYYRVDAVDPRHESSLYLMEGTDRPYPMHYALRFHIDKRRDGWSTYWLHGRDLPGYPASHGCIGLYDEEMQKEYYNEPERPILMDAKKLYDWVVRDAGEVIEFQKLIYGPRVVITGEPPAPVPEYFSGGQFGASLAPGKAGAAGP